MVRWTHDGKALLYIDHSRVYRVSIEGGTPELLGDGASWAEDCGGRLLIVYNETQGCAQCQRIVLREPEGQERDVIHFPSGMAVAYPRCDREGRRVLYSLSGLSISMMGFGPNDLWLLELDGGSPRRLTTDQGLIIGSFTPDGRSIVFSADHGDRSHLWEVPVDRSAEPTQLTFGDGHEYAPDVSLDGRLVLYDIDITSHELFAQPLDGGAQRRLTSTFQHVSFPQPTPDGREIIAQIFPHATRVIARIPADGGDAVVLAEGATPSITPDGSEILFSRSTRVFGVPTAGGAARLLTEFPGAVLELHVGPDGMVHAMVAGLHGWEAWSVPLVDGVAGRELPAPWSVLVPAPRSGWRAAIQMIGRGPWRARFLAPGASFDARTAREITSTGRYAWAPDGLSWFYVQAGFVHRLWLNFRPS